MWESVKMDLKERLMQSETLNGAFVFIPWGIGFFYYGFPWGINADTFFEIITQPQFGYNYGLMSLGIVLICWGLSKTFVNRVKQKARFEAMLERRRKMQCY